MSSSNRLRPPKRRLRPGLAALPLAALLAWGAEVHPILPIGSAAPDFALPGVDGKIHRLADYAASPILVVVFTCNHCPIAQLYERRIQQLYEDYRDKGVAVVAIQPNAPEALRIDELDSSDMSDTLAEMKIRVAYKHLSYPYLYDGETQAVARAYGPQATPHVFVFDRERRLRYEGRVDNSYRVELVKTQDARNAIDALLAGKPVEVTHTGVFGCSTKWKEKEAERLAALRKLEEKPVTLELASAEDLKKLRANPAKKLTLVSFWDTPVRIVHPAVRRHRRHLPDVRRAWIRTGHRGSGLTRRARRRPADARKAARHQPQPAVRLRARLRSGLGLNGAIHRVNYPGWKNGVPEARRGGYVGAAANDPGKYRLGIRRLQSILGEISDRRVAPPRLGRISLLR